MAGEEGMIVAFVILIAIALYIASFVISIINIVYISKHRKDEDQDTKDKVDSAKRKLYGWGAYFLIVTAIILYFVYDEYRARRG